jgi:hypothetical protein
LMRIRSTATSKVFTTIIRAIALFIFFIQTIRTICYQIEDLLQ